jgi:hypothetical protein
LKKFEEEQEALKARRRDQEKLTLEAMQFAQEEAQRKELLEEQRRMEEQKVVEQRKKELQATLPPEPEEGCSGATTSVLFRLPDGSKISRRFLIHDAVSVLFHFCDSHGAGGFSPESYCLVMQYPRRVIEPSMSLALKAVGLSAGHQEAVVLEPRHNT